MKNVLVIGDVILDEYVFLSSERQCSEAPLPVWNINKKEYHLGGAANVAVNLMKLGDDIKVYFAGMAGNNSYYAMRNTNINCHLLYKLNEGHDIIKTRFVQEPVTSLKQSMIARVDNRKQFSNLDAQTFEESILLIDKSDFDLIIISDYRMGTITEKIAKFFCENPNCKVIVDSKRNNLSIFKGATVLKLNQQEYDIQLACKDYLVDNIAQFCIVTKGEKGATVSTCSQTRIKNQVNPMYTTHSMHFPVEKVPVVDVTGCGDVFTAAIGYFLATKLDDVYIATKFANACATAAVQKLGTSKY